MANERILDSKIQLRNDTSANWKAANPVLLKGELGIEIDTRKIKIGDGISAWTALKYISDEIVIANADPTASDKDFDIGRFWLNQADKKLFVLIATSDINAVWKRIVTDEELVKVDIAKLADEATKLQTARSISLTGDATGVATFDGTEDVAISVVLKNTGATEGTFTKLTVNEKGLIVKCEVLTPEDIPELTLAKITDAGTAAARDVGTAEGNLVELGADGKIDSNLLPSIAITEPHAVENEAEMLALEAQVGDIAIRTDESKSYILKAKPATDKKNWLELLSPDCHIVSVNGKGGVVVLTTDDIEEKSNLYYTEERDTANFEKNFAKKSAADLAGGEHVLSETDTFILNGGNA